MNEPTAAERARAWEREEPAELRRSAAEWRALGCKKYAAYLERWADGVRAPFMQRPY